MISGVGEAGVYGLVLAGGKSSRMGGMDKGLADWHGKPQRYYMADLLGKICDQVFISCREEQVAGIDKNYKTLTDNYVESGPTGGILTAFEHFPAAAWLVVACDLPFVDLETLTFLVKNRNKTALATTFESPHDHLPEPLITIWEPSSYNVLLGKLKEGCKCPRKILINSHVQVLEAPSQRALMNVNTPEDAIKARDTGVYPV